MLEKKLEKIKKIVAKELSCSAHDMDHVLRVYNMALKIAKKEKNVDYEILKPAVLLHDIARVREDEDKTGRICHAEESVKMSKPILEKLYFSEEKIKKIQDCILSHRFKTKNRPQSIEAKILFDADKLDALGAIMIMRAGMWIERNSASVFPKMKLEDYIKKNLVGGKADGRIKDNSLHCLYYEYELKNKKLPKIMQTKIGKKIALERLEFNRIFLDRLTKESKGII